MRHDDADDGDTRIEPHRLQILQGRASRFVRMLARIDDDPFAIAYVDQNGFSEARTNDGDLNLIAGWRYS
jgi:hypothetical protein